MDKKLRYLGLLAILPLFTFAITTNYIIDADAIKAKGVGTKQFGSLQSLSPHTILFVAEPNCFVPVPLDFIASASIM